MTEPSLRERERVAELAQIYSAIAWREAANRERPREEVMDRFVSAGGWQPAWFDEALAELERRERARVS